MNIVKLLLILLYVSFCFGAAPESTKQVQVLTLSITPTHQAATVGAGVSVKSKLTNQTNHEIEFFDTKFDCDYAVEVRDDKGRLAPQTSYKRQLNCNATAGDTRNILVSLKPQESVEEDILITKTYDLNRPGSYAVQVFRKVPPGLSKQSIKSNIVGITITQ
jgi:hypothetical protein